MEILFLMVPLGMVLVGVGIWAFFWAAGSGQFDDLDSPGWTVLEDESKQPPAGTPPPGDSTAPEEPPEP